MAARREDPAGRRENAMSGKSLMHGQRGVVPRHSTDEAAEQGRGAAGGGCGGKAVDQGEHASV